MEIQKPRLSSPPIRNFRIKWTDQQGSHYIDIEHHDEYTAIQWFQREVQEDYDWISPK
jgi:hypothetical protein